MLRRDFLRSVAAALGVACVPLAVKKCHCDEVAISPRECESIHAKHRGLRIGDTIPVYDYNRVQIGTAVISGPDPWNFQRVGREIKAGEMYTFEITANGYGMKLLS